MKYIKGKSGSGVFLLVIKYFHILSVDTHNIDIKYQIQYQSQIYKEVHMQYVVEKINLKFILIIFIWGRFILIIGCKIGTPFFISTLNHIS